MTTTQTQLRRGTATQCNGMTPADGEPIYDQTNDRIRIGDGTTLGGNILPNVYDIVGGKLNTVHDTGTVNHIVASVPIDPGAPYDGMTVVIKIATTPTSAFDLNLNSHGAIAVYKVASGSVTSTTGGEATAGAFHVFRFDGTHWLMETGSGGGVTVTSTGGTLSVATAAGVSNVEINTNNAAGVGTTIMAAYHGVSLVNGGTTTGSNLTLFVLDIGVNKASTFTASIGFGTWRNITGRTLPAPVTGSGSNAATIGTFIRIS